MKARHVTLLLFFTLHPIVAPCSETFGIDLLERKRDIMHATVGEDATSTFHYFFYSVVGGDRLAKVRILWNGGAQNRPSITDYYLDGSSILVVDRLSARSHLPTLLSGADAPFEPVTELRFKSQGGETLLGEGEPGQLSKEERIALSNLIDALSLAREPIAPGLK